MDTYGSSPMKMHLRPQTVSLLEEDEVEFLVGDVSDGDLSFASAADASMVFGMLGGNGKKGGKENMPR